MREAVRVLLAVALLSAAYARPNVYEADALAASERFRSLRVVRELEVASDSMSQLEVEAGEALVREKRGDQLDDWLTDEQKEEITTLKENGGSEEEVRDVIMRYYQELPEETRVQYDAKYKKECIAWVQRVASEEEVLELKELYAAKDIATLENKLKEYMERLSDKEKVQVLAWKEPCKKLWENDQAQTIARRLRRELGEEGVQEWNELLTHAERQQLRDLHADRADRDRIESQIHHVYLRMPLHHQEALQGRFKERCLRYLRDVAENGEYESFVDGSDADEVVHKYFARLIFERHNQLRRFKSLCHEVLSSKRRRREIESQFTDWMSWMTDEQKQEISSMKDAGRSYDEIHDKVIEHFNSLDTSRQGALRSDYKQKCKNYFKKLATADELEKMDELFQAGKETQVKDIIQTVIDRQPEDVQVSARKFQKICSEVFGTSRKRRTISDQIDKTLSWLSPEQKEEIREMHEQGRPQSEIKAKFWEYLDALDADKKKRVTEATIKSCYAWMEDVTSVEERDEIQRLHHIDHNQCKEKVYGYLERLPKARQDKIRKYLDVCERLWYGSHHGGDHSEHHGHHHGRKRRHGDHSKLNQFMDKYLGWMSDEEKMELEQAYGEDHDRLAVRDKVIEMFEEAKGEKKDQATKSLKAACKMVLASVVGEENVQELEELKDSGATKAQIVAKVQELTDAVVDDERRTIIEEYGPTCRKVFQVGHRGRRHDGVHTHEHGLEHYIEHHLQWLTEDQKDELRSMKAEGADRKELQEKVFEFFGSAEGEAKEQGAQELQKGCREIMKSVIGEEKAAELRVLKESGATFKELEEKLAEMIADVPNNEMKERALDFQESCKAVFGIPKRSRRDHHEHSHTLKHYLEHHLKWLTPDQKDELKLMKVNGKSKKEIQAEVFKYYAAATGEVKEQAKEQLQAGCRELLVEVVGEEEANKIKAMKESGAGMEAVEGKVKELLDAVTDEHKKEIVQDYAPMCKKLFSGSRRRRHDGHEHHDHHEHGHTLENYLNTHLKWLSEEQKEELRGMKANGRPQEDIQKKIFDFFSATSGETRDEAIQQLQGGCRELLTEVVGKAEAMKLKEMRETGASVSEMEDKVNELIAAVTDDHKKQLAKDFGPSCKKLYGISASRTRRHEHHNHHAHGHTLEDYLTTHLKWLTEEQQDELRGMKANGRAQEDIQEKIFDFYGATEGEKREQATKEMQTGCREIISEVIGKEEAVKLRELKENGASVTEIENKISALVAGLTDGHKKDLAEQFGPGCRKVFGLGNLRRRRDHHHEHEHSLEHYLSTHLKWLSEEQKDELRDMKANGMPRGAIQEKVFEFFNAATGETKEAAIQQLQGGCRALLTEVVGKTEATKLKELKESGASVSDIEKKLNELMDSVTDEHKKQLAKEYGPSCRKVFGLTTSRKRRTIFDDFVMHHLNWLTEEQKDKIKAMKAEGKSQADIHATVTEYYRATTGDVREKATQHLQEACRELLLDLIGKDKVGDVKAMRESGATVEEIEGKLKEHFGGITDVEKQKQAALYGPSCKKLFGGQRRRRSHHDLEKYFSTHLSWLSDEQKAEIREMKLDGESRSAIQEKVMAFYEATQGKAREEATEQLQNGCRHLFESIVGQEKAAELKALRERGASFSEIEEQVTEAFAEIDDEHKMKLASEFRPVCNKLFRAVSRRRRDHHHGHGHTLDDYFKTHLKWLSEEQKTELKGMKADGKSRSDIQAKVFEFYNAATGDKKEEATEQLKGGCRELLASVVGKDNAAEVKAMKESGASLDELQKKVNELIAGVEDEHKKKIAEEYGPACRKVFSVGAARKRRDHHHGHGHHTLEDYFKTHLKWLSDEQKEELRTLKADGKSRSDIQAKVFEFYNVATGDKKEEATEQLKGGCRELLASVVGKDKAAEVKAMKESGASLDELQKKVNELIAGVEDEHKKKIAEEYGPACRKVFSVGASRKRRDHHHGHGHHTLEDYFKTHLKWLSDEQKEELRTLKADGKSRSDIQAKVFEFYNAATGDKKEEATEQLKGGCRELLASVVGKDNAAEVKAMKESGASLDELQKKVNELIAGVEDEHKKKIAEEYGPACRKVFSVGASRKRRDHHHGHGHHTLEDYFKTHLKWLSDEQKEELRTLKADGKSRADIQAKVFEFYNAATGDKKEEATEQLKGGCRELLQHIVGKEKAAELKTLKESGASVSDIQQKVDQLLDGLEDEHKKQIARDYGPACKRVFGVAEGRFRRHRAERSEARVSKFQKIISVNKDWMTNEQVEELKKMKGDKVPPVEFREKIMKFYQATEEDAREKATLRLQSTCKVLLEEAVGVDKVEELDQMRRDQVPREEIIEKVDELFDEIEDEKTRREMEVMRPVCERVLEYPVHGRQRRTARDRDLSMFREYLEDWLTEEQMHELEAAYYSDAPEKTLKTMVLQYFVELSEPKRQALEVKWKGQCLGWLVEVTTEEQRDHLQLLMRSKEIDVLREQILLFMNKLSEERRRKVALTREVCENLFGLQ